MDNLTRAFNDSEGAAGGMAEIMDDTAEGAIKRMQSAEEHITIDQLCTPTILDIIKSIERLAGSSATWLSTQDSL